MNLLLNNAQQLGEVLHDFFILVVSGAEAAASIIQPLHICIDFIHRGLDVTVDRLQIINGVLNHLNRICGLLLSIQPDAFPFPAASPCLLLLSSLKAIHFLLSFQIYT